MAQAIPSPTLPHATLSAATSPQAVPIEERVSVLETHRHTLTPTLATKADVKGAENRMIMWAVGAALALLAAVAGLLTAAGARTDAALADIRADMRTMNARLDAAITANTARIDKLDAKSDALAARQDRRMDGLDAKIDRLDAKLDARFEALMAELRAQRRGGE